MVAAGAISDTDACLEGVCLALRDILGNKKVAAAAVRPTSAAEEEKASCG